MAGLFDGYAQDVNHPLVQRFYLAPTIPKGFTFNIISLEEFNLEYGY